MLFGVLFISACGLNMYRVVIQQGNVVTQDMIDQLKPGMTREQVSYVMGQPIMRNTFNNDRWDFVYTLELPGRFSQDARVSIFFENNVLSHFTGDLAPTTYYGAPSETSETNQSEEES